MSGKNFVFKELITTCAEKLLYVRKKLATSPPYISSHSVFEKKWIKNSGKNMEIFTICERF